MARVDYYALETAVKTALEADAAVVATAGLVILVEEEVSMHRVPVVVITLASRAAPDELQPLRAGKGTRFLVELVLFVYFYALDVSEAARQRDDLVGKVEIALMNDRTLGGACNYLYLTGGTFVTARDESGFNSGAEVRVTVDVTATA